MQSEDGSPKKTKDLAEKTKEPFGKIVGSTASGAK